MLANVLCELSTARSEDGAARRPSPGHLRQDPSLTEISNLVVVHTIDTTVHYHCRNDVRIPLEVAEDADAEDSGCR